MREELMGWGTRGRNCIFVYKVLEDGTLELTDKSIATRSNDAPRHVTPHPNGKYIYSLEEHSSMVDIFSVRSPHVLSPLLISRLSQITEGKLTHVSGVKIIPSQLSCSLFWADEVRVSPSSQFLYASTRGLVPSQNGWVAAFELNEDGRWKSEEPVGMWETPTSGYVHLFSCSARELIVGL
jgi:carboxy-cis,cis-muconate cyclase